MSNSKIYRIDDINKRVTEVVSEYVASGYMVNIRKTLSEEIVLCKGNSYINVSMHLKYSNPLEIAVISVNKWEDDTEHKQVDKELVLKEKYFCISRITENDADKMVFTKEKEIAKEANMKRYIRSNNKRRKPMTIKNEHALDIALRIVRRFKGYKRLKKESIEMVIKTGEGANCTYYIYIKDKPDITILKKY